MTTMQQIVVAVFDDRAQAEQAVNALQNAGFSDDQIKFAGHGASTGGILDSLKSLFTGQQAGSVYDDLVSMGVPQADASYYQREFEAGHSIVTVLAGERMQEATALLARYGGYGANRRFAQTTDAAETADTSIRGAPGPAGPYAQTTDAAETADTSIRGAPGPAGPYAQTADAVATPDTSRPGTPVQAGPYAQTADAAATAGPGMQETETGGEQQLKLREEELRAQKQPVETGEARLRKDVVTEQKSIDVPVSREEVYVERRPGSGQPADQPIGEGETYRVPVREEQVTVEKQPYVREEVAMGKRPVQETQRVSDTVRREEAHIERAGDIDVQGSDVKEVSDQTDQTTP